MKSSPSSLVKKIKELFPGSLWQACLQYIIRISVIYSYLCTLTFLSAGLDLLHICDFLDYSDYWYNLIIVILEII